MYENYAKLRDQMGWKDYEVCKKIGMSPGTMSDWKKGRYNLKAEKLRKIADLFGVTVDYLMGVQTNVHQIELSAEEMQLLRIFRGLNDVGRARALESLEDMLQIPKYTDKSKESAISNAG